MQLSIDGGWTMRCYPIPIIVISTMLLIVPVASQASLVISVGADKTVYGEKEVITFTGQVQRFDGCCFSLPVASALVAFEIRDAQNNIKASGYTTTDQNGIYSGTLTVTGSSTQGPYSLCVSVTIGGQTAANCTTFQVVPEFPNGAEIVALLALVVVVLMLRRAGGNAQPSEVSVRSFPISQNAPW